MKFIASLIMLLAATVGSQAQSKVVEDSIQVYGNCKMCKARIEAAMDIKGVKTAEWNVNTKKLFIAYRQDKLSAQEIHQAIAAAGHDTDSVKADDRIYAELPFCCLYRDHDPHGENGEELHDPHKDGHHE